MIEMFHFLIAKSENLLAFVQWTLPIRQHLLFIFCDVLLTEEDRGKLRNLQARIRDLCSERARISQSATMTFTKYAILDGVEDWTKFEYVKNIFKGC